VTDAVATSAIVLAGGRSSRFGAPKLAAELEGRTLLEHAVRAVAQVAREIVVALPSGTPEPIFNGLESETRATIRFVHDLEDFGGPLVGLANALGATTNSVAIVVGGDMPRLQPAVLRMLREGLAVGGNRVGHALQPAVEAVVLGQQGGRQPLPMALLVAPATREGAAAIASGKRSLRALLDRLVVRELPETQWRALDPGAETLIDIDVPGDLDRVTNL
jgi:molybdopterin-guanine dinucleotide biosynthesis protein A